MRRVKGRGGARGGVESGEGDYQGKGGARGGEGQRVGEGQKVRGPGLGNGWTVDCVSTSTSGAGVLGLWAGVLDGA